MNEFITRQEFTERIMNVARHQAEGLSLESCKEAACMRFEGVGMNSAGTVYLMIACVERIKREDQDWFDKHSAIPFDNLPATLSKALESQRDGGEEKTPW